MSRPVTTTGHGVELERVSQVDGRALRSAFGSFPTGVGALCAIADGHPAGLAASSFTSVSLAPALVSVCVAHSSTTWPRLDPAPRLGLSVFGHDQADLCRVFAAARADRFAGVEYSVSADGAVFVGGSALWLDLSRVDQLRAGDHDIVVFEVHRFLDFPEVAPLIFHRGRLGGLTAFG